jgi:tetratricopeptide (TPR) repeat protein
LYLKGQFFWNKRTPEGLRQAVDYFQQAVIKDPNYARAYAGLANSYALMGGYSGEPQAEFIPKARGAALRALELDENLGEAHAALALIAQNYDWDWETADKEYRRAIELNPNYATAHHWYAEHLAFLGRFDEALRESESARELDPLSLIIATDNGEILYLSRQYDRAIEKLRAVLEVDPNFLHAHIVEYVYVQKGMFSDAQVDLEKLRRVDASPWSLAQSAYVLGRFGHQAEAERAVDKLEQLNRRHQIDPAPILIAYVGMGNKEKAFTWLEKAYSQHSNVLATLKVDPAFDPLRNDPRFNDLLRRVGLVQLGLDH